MYDTFAPSANVGYYQGGTYAGNPVSCAAAVACMDVMREEKILDNVKAR
jgi:adenosylmethionine-8-amino-7-oxononanoate aminotransferase